MGFWNLFEFSVSETAVIDASCEHLWAIVSDMENYENVLSVVQSTTRVTNTAGGPLLAGTQLQRHLVVGEDMLVSNVTITAMSPFDDGVFPKTVAIFADNFGGRLTGRISWTVEPVEGNDANQSRLVISSTMLPRSLWLHAGNTRIPVWGIRSLTRKVLRRDLQEFGRAAVLRS